MIFHVIKFWRQVYQNFTTKILPYRDIFDNVTLFIEIIAVVSLSLKL